MDFTPDNPKFRPLVHDRIKASLLEGEMGYKSVFEDMKAGMAVYRAINQGENFIFVDFNPAGEMLDQVKKEELIGKRVTEIFPGIRDFGLLEVFQKVWSTGESVYVPLSLYRDNRIEGWRENHIYKLPGGEIAAIYRDEESCRRPCGPLRSISPVLEPASPFSFVLRGCKDRNFYNAIETALYKSSVESHVRSLEKEKQELREQLLHLQKMEAIGTLAGGIAHDFNNILFPISGHIEMILEDLPESDPLHEQLCEVFSAVGRAKDLVKQILKFSRQSRDGIKPVKIQDILGEIEVLIRASIPSTILIKQHISSDCGQILANPTQIHQVIMNLVTNAYHAMEKKGGTLEIKLEKVCLDTGDIKGRDLVPGEYACLIVSDTGKGMNKKVISRIFDAYFTTKSRDKGTGLGLSVVREIIKRNNGDIRVYSSPGKGSIFQIFLPCVNIQYEAESVKEIGPQQIGSERILLVDDEMPVVQMEKQMLERMGYRVASRTNSRDALKAFKSTPQSYDLVITDMTMPEMTGIELARKLRKIRPDIPIIISTGFSEALSPEKAESMKIQGVIMKPIVKNEFSGIIRSILDANSLY